MLPVREISEEYVAEEYADHDECLRQVGEPGLFAYQVPLRNARLREYAPVIHHVGTVR